ncbi:hypothetical protein IGB42_00748 [Andreprevotia sp. IGB-42]|uniref:hypothetical protein n=1 Tax=Andreprevotia sp. IGB-42 TaxID=2497473 RepID=UPI001356835C|nr:hypothetical protein [Andreprevotia sp. IGB-42]KAF0814693.1 hypothetical protein IGB42_00748 [Andreprevotia sp. IGB-42]
MSYDRPEEESSDRFSLDGIQKQQDALARAKENASKKGDRSGGRLMALTNLPLLIALVAFLWWKFH